MEMINLPWDVIEEILFRVPIKSMARFRLVSKGWNALSQSGSFVKKHSANALKESLSIMLIDSRVCLVKINLHGFQNSVAPSAKVAYQFNLEDPLSSSSQVDIRGVFHCDGLLLCTTKESRLVVWNPCSEETKWIKPSNSYPKHDDEYDPFALGYDNKSSCRQYKILRGRRKVRNGYTREYEIYDFTSDSWRDLGVTTNWSLGSRHGGISMKGNTYWVALHDTTEEVSYPLFLQRFDFSAERFQRVSLPPSLARYSAALSVVREEQLFLLGSDYERDFNVWVTTSPGSVKSWSKFLTLKGKPVKDFYGLSFLADEQNKAIVYCNHNKILHIVGGNKHIKVDPRDGKSTIRPSPRPLLLNYVPSSAQIANCKPQSMWFF